MEDKLINCKIDIHKKQVEKLKEIESKLVKLISDTNNEILMEVFIDWQNQRYRCNSSFLATINIISTNDNEPF